MPRVIVLMIFDIHELKYGQAEEKLEAGGDDKIWSGGGKTRGGRG